MQLLKSNNTHAELVAGSTRGDCGSHIETIACHSNKWPTANWMGVRYNSIWAANFIENKHWLTNYSNENKFILGEKLFTISKWWHIQSLWVVGVVSESSSLLHSKQICRAFTRACCFTVNDNNIIYAHCFARSFVVVCLVMPPASQ